MRTVGELVGTTKASSSHDQHVRLKGCGEVWYREGTRQQRTRPTATVDRQTPGRKQILSFGWRVAGATSHSAVRIRVLLVLVLLVEAIVVLLCVTIAHLLRLHARADNDIVAGVCVRFGGINVLRLRLRAVRAIVLGAVPMVALVLLIACLVWVRLAIGVLLPGLDRLVLLVGVCGGRILLLVGIVLLAAVPVGAVCTCASHTRTSRARDGRGDVVSAEVALDHGRRARVEGVRVAVVHHDARLAEVDGVEVLGFLTASPALNQS